jgi:hypothetical protein
MMLVTLLATMSIGSVYARENLAMSEDIKQTLTPALTQLKSVAPSEFKDNLASTINWFNQQGFVNKRTLKDLEAQLRTLRKLNLQTPSKQQRDFDTQVNGVLGMIDGLKSKLRWSWV